MEKNHPSHHNPDTKVKTKIVYNNYNSMGHTKFDNNRWNTMSRITMVVNQSNQILISLIM